MLFGPSNSWLGQKEFSAKSISRFDQQLFSTFACERVCRGSGIQIRRDEE
jgi:hypothetical protein